MIDNLRRHEYTRANEVEKKVIETHTEGLIENLRELIIKYHSVCHSYQDVSDRLNDRIEQIGYTNPAFEFDPKSTFEIRNGCRIMYDMCEKDTYESVKERAQEIQSLEESLAELYRLYEITFLLLRGNEQLLNQVEDNVAETHRDAFRAEKLLTKAIQFETTIDCCGCHIPKWIFYISLALSFIAGSLVLVFVTSLIL